MKDKLIILIALALVGIVALFTNRNDDDPDINLG